MKTFRKGILFLLAALVLTSMLALPAAAEEEKFEILLQTKDTSYKVSTFTLVLRNMATGEEKKVDLEGNRGENQWVRDFNDGVYEPVRCYLRKHPDTEFDITYTNGPLDLTDEKWLHHEFIVRIADRETGEEAGIPRGVLVERIQIFTTFLYLLVPVLYVIRLIFFILGRKNIHRRAIGRLIRHLHWAIWGLIVGGLAVGDLPFHPFVTLVFFTCAPFGLGAAAIALHIRVGVELEQARLDELSGKHRELPLEENGNPAISYCLFFLILAVIAGIFGVICMPIVLHRDIDDIQCT